MRVLLLEMNKLIHEMGRNGRKDAAELLNSGLLGIYDKGKSWQK